MNAVSKIKFSCDWLSAGSDEAEVRDTCGQLSIYIDNLCLTQNEDIWSKTIRDSVLVSAYPLALWLASSWWRILYEPLPKMADVPAVDWRMSHELGAANHGFVWPKVMFATDGDAVQIWAGASAPNVQQSVRYLNSLEVPARVIASDFERGVEGFIGSVLSRLHALGHTDNALTHVWGFVQEDRADQGTMRKRRLEAQLGYDPEECAEDILEKAIALEDLMGEAAISEVAPVFGQAQGVAAIEEILKLANAPGLSGKPQIHPIALSARETHKAPWERGVSAANKLRSQIGNQSKPISSKDLYDILGLNDTSVADWVPQPRQKVAIAQPAGEGGWLFKLRKKHPVGQRFELARLLGEWLTSSQSSSRWLASTDLSTSRQKFQRAFAAEFLCPIHSLATFLDGDYSETAIEEAAAEFDVSEMTVQSLLANNGYIAPPSFPGSFPYPLAA